MNSFFRPMLIPRGVDPFVGCIAADDFTLLWTNSNQLYYCGSNELNIIGAPEATIWTPKKVIWWKLRSLFNSFCVKIAFLCLTQFGIFCDFCRLPFLVLIRNLQSRVLTTLRRRQINSSVLIFIRFGIHDIVVNNAFFIS